MPRSNAGKWAGALAPARLVVTISDVLAALFLMAMMCVAFADVVGRSFFNAPLPGATELTELLVAGTIAAILPSLAMRGMHATIDVLDIFVPRALRRWQMGLADLLGAVSFAFVAWRVWIEGDKTARFGGQTPLLEIPMAPVLYAVSVFFALSALAFLVAIAPPHESD